MKFLSNNVKFGFAFSILFLLSVTASQTVLAQEGMSGLFLMQLGIIALDDNPKNIAVDEELNRVYVGLEGKIVVIDGENDRFVQEIILGLDVKVLEFNSWTGHLYASCYDRATYESRVYVIDSENGEIVGCIEEYLSYPYEISVNPSTNRIYIADPTGVMGQYDEVHVYDGDSLTEVYTINIPESDMPLYVQDVGVAVNPSSNRVYVAWSYRRTLLVYDGADHTLIIKRENLTSFSENIFVNPSTGRVYIGGLTLDESLNPVEGVGYVSSNQIKAYIPNLDLLVCSTGYGSLSLLSGQDNGEIASLNLDYEVDHAAVNLLMRKIYVLNEFNPTVYVISFGLDYDAPSIIINSPKEGSLLTAETLRVEWTGFDETSGIEHYEIRLDEGGWVNVGLETSHNFTYIYDGNRSVSVKAFDYAGNWDEVTVNFYVDTTPPSIYFLIPTDGETVKSTDITVEWGGYDDYGIERFEIRIDGGEWIDKGVSEEHSFMQLEEGTHTLTLRAYDVAGNVAELSIAFMVNLSLIGGPGWVDEVIIFSVAVLIAAAVLFALSRRRRKTL